MGNSTLDISALESRLWEKACKIRGPVDAPKDYVLPLIFLKRLSDVFEDEVESLGQTHGSAEMAASLVEEDHVLAFYYRR